MKTTLLETEEQALEVARALAADWAKGAGERDASRRLPHPEVEALCASGLLGITVPRAHGGLGISRVGLVRVLDLLSSGDPNLGQLTVGHWYIVDALGNGASDAQRDRWYRRALDGELFGNAFAEAGGKTCGELSTTFTPVPGGFRIDGAKFYSTGSLYARWVGTVGLDPDDRVHLALMDRHAPGLTIVDDWSGIGQRTTASGSAKLEGVVVDAFDVLPHYEAFEKLTCQVLNASLLHPAIDIGIARGAFAEARAFVKTQARPWIESPHQTATEDPYVLHKFGEMALLLQAGEALLERAARAADHAARETTEATLAAGQVAVALAVAMAEKASLFIASTLFEVGGSRAAAGRFHHDRHWRNARVHTLHDPVAWKYWRIGNYYLNDVPPRRDR